MRPSRIVSLVLGCVLMIPALAVLFGGGALGLAYAVARDDDGYFEVTLDRLETDSVAITAGDVTLETDPGSPDWVLDALDVDVRLRVTSADTQQAVFVGIGPQVDVEAYLAGVAHVEIVEVEDGLEPVYRSRTGGESVAAPTGQDFWAASAAGTGTQELEWEAEEGRWTAVVMNADGSPVVSADADVGAKADFVLPLAITMGVGGAILAAVALVLIIVGAAGVRRGRDDGAEVEQDRQASPPTPAPTTESSPTVGGHRHGSVSLTASLDPELSRWQWLVKWFLAIPHAIVLVFLWLAFVVLTLVAAVAIVFTGRYPKGIFDFNVGVLRWTWRVNFYASTGGIGTDRYPSFSLEPAAGEPTHLDIVYPERLSRGLVFVKWLLAIPHLVIIGLIAGSWAGGLADDGFFEVLGTVLGGGGLLGLLVLIAGLALLFTGRYPQPLFDLIIGFNRWIFRTIAYVALMTDEYPPFRLDQGGGEPIAGSPSPPVPPPPAAPPHGVAEHADLPAPVRRPERIGS